VKKTILIFLGFIIPFLINSQNCGDLRVHVIPQNSFYQVMLTTNYDSLVNLNPNISNSNTSGFYDWRAYPPGNHNWSGNTHIWQSTIPDPTYSVTLNDDNIFFILSLLMGDTSTSTTPVTHCILPFFIARDSLMPSYWNLTMLNTGFTNISNLESKNKKLVNVYNLAGQIVEPKKMNHEMVIYLYSDGSTEKKFIEK
jgi:hypothetical protein